MSLEKREPGHFHCHLLQCAGEKGKQMRIRNKHTN